MSVIRGRIREKTCLITRVMTTRHYKGHNQEGGISLGVTEGAIRKRIQRGSMNKEMVKDGEVYVYLNMYEDTSHPKVQVDHEPLVEDLRDRVRFLEQELDRRSLLRSRVRRSEVSEGF